MYTYTVIMNNGNKYEIISECEANELLNNIYGVNSNCSKTISSWRLKKRLNSNNVVVINSEYISEILFDGVIDNGEE